MIIIHTLCLRRVGEPACVCTEKLILLLWLDTRTIVIHFSTSEKASAKSEGENELRTMTSAGRRSTHACRFWEKLSLLQIFHFIRVYQMLDASVRFA